MTLLAFAGVFVFLPLCTCAYAAQESPAASHCGHEKNSPSPVTSDHCCGKCSVGVAERASHEVFAGPQLPQEAGSLALSDGEPSLAVFRARSAGKKFYDPDDGAGGHRTPLFLLFQSLLI